MKALTTLLFVFFSIVVQAGTFTDPDEEKKTDYHVEHDDEYPMYVPTQGYYKTDSEYFVFNMIVADGDKVYFDDKDIKQKKGQKEVYVIVKSKNDATCDGGITIEDWLTVFDPEADAPMYLNLPGKRKLVSFVAKFSVADDNSDPANKKTRGVLFKLGCHPGEGGDAHNIHISGTLGHPKG